MIIGTYNPNAQAYCDHCKKVQEVKTTAGNFAFVPRYMEFNCKICGTESKIWLDDPEMYSLGTTTYR